MSEPSGHSVRFDSRHCDGCLACVRACPTSAVRVRNGTAVMLDDRCIDCGECFKVCSRHAVRPLTGTLAELSRFDYLVAIPSPALYTQFDTNASPGLILEALKRIGFNDAVDLSPACDAASIAIDQYLAEYRGQHPVISSFCPTVVRLIQVKYPTLLDQVLPVLSPREVTARELHRRKVRETGLPPDRIGIVYITPCPAKLVSFIDHPGLERSFIDSAVSFSDVFLHLMAAIGDIEEEGILPEPTESASALSWSLSTGVAGSRSAEDTLAVAGLPNVTRILDDIEKGKLRRYAFVECHACPQGCVSGVLTVEDPYVARARAIRLIRARGEGRPAAAAGGGVEFPAPEFRMPHRIAPRPMRPLHDDLALAISRMTERERFMASLPGIDCAACGAPTCEAFAEDVVRGEAADQACVFVRQREVEQMVRTLSALIRRQSSARGPSAGSRARGAARDTDETDTEVTGQPVTSESARPPKVGEEEP